MGLLEHFTKEKITQTLKDDDVRQEIIKISGSVDRILDRIVGDKGSTEIRELLIEVLDLVKEELKKEQ